MKKYLLALALVASALSLAGCLSPCNSNGQKSVVFDLPGVRMRQGPSLEEQQPAKVYTTRTRVVDDETVDTRDVILHRSVAPVDRGAPCQPPTRSPFGP